MKIPGIFKSTHSAQCCSTRCKLQVTFQLKSHCPTFCKPYFNKFQYLSAPELSKNFTLLSITHPSTIVNPHQFCAVTSLRKCPERKSYTSHDIILYIKESL